jgi:hypothetical protein
MVVPRLCPGQWAAWCAHSILALRSVRGQLVGSTRGAQGAYLVRECEEVDGYRTAAAHSQYSRLEMLDEEAQLRLQAWPVARAENVRLVFCCLQALQELRALELCRLYRLGFRIRFGLCARIPLSASLSIMSTSVAVSVSACIVGGGRGVAATWRGWRRYEGLLVDCRTQSSRSIQEPCRIATDVARTCLNHHRRCNQHFWGLHVPALSGALQGDRRCLP